MKRPLFILCLLISCFLAVFSNFSSDYRERFFHLDGQKYTLTGTVDSIEFKKSGNDILTVVYLKEGVIAYLDETSRYPKIGSVVKISGTVRLFEEATNPGQFSTKEYYEILKIYFRLNNATILEESDDYSIIRNSLFKLRLRIDEILDNTLDEETASIMKTMLLGEKGTLDRDIKELYERNGIAHILSISGLHISLIGLGLFKILRKMHMNLRVAGILSSAILIFYVLMTGFSVSSFRAVFMFLLSMIAKLIGRTYDMATAAGICAMAILIEQPLYIHHLGFCFSFGCVIGISLWGNILIKKNARFLARVLLQSLTMLVITLPLYYIYSYQIPVYSAFLNILVIPSMAVLIPLGVILIVLGSISYSLGSVFGILITGIINLFKWLATLGDRLPYHFYTPGTISVIRFVLYFVGLEILSKFKNKLSVFKRTCVIMIFTILLTIRVKAKYSIFFIDVGQGDCSLIQSSSSIVFPGISREINIMIDGGSSSVNSVGQYRIIPFLKYQGISCLDAVIVTHPDEDHINGIMELINIGPLNGITIQKIILNKAPNSERSEKYQEIISLALNNNIEIQYFEAGDVISADDLILRCIWPISDYNLSNTNEESLVFNLRAGNISILFTGDIEKDAEKRMAHAFAANLTLEKDTKLNDGLIISHEMRILKCAHHGSSTSTSSELLNLYNPVVSIISCGKNNRYGHPHSETIKALKTIDSEILRTDENGAITLASDGTDIDITYFVKQKSDP